MGASLSGARFAAVDIGSHTIRLLIARLEDEHTLIPLRVERRITRLARHFLDGETLKEAGMRDSLTVMEEYAGLLKGHDVQAVTCGATGVVRRAKNSKDFLRTIHEKTGIHARILSESSEAILSTIGVLSVLEVPQGFILVFDLGGSSTEFVLVNTKRPEPLWSTSVFIGATTITERHLGGDPPPQRAVHEAEDAVREALTPTLSTVKAFLSDSGKASSPLHVVGTAGTVTTLAAMALRMTSYQAWRVNGTILSAPWLSETINRLAPLPLAARRGIPGLEEGREDIILGGAILVREILRGLDEPQVTVTDGGLLEGLLLDLLERRLERSSTLLTPFRWRLQ